MCVSLSQGRTRTLCQGCVSAHQIEKIEKIIGKIVVSYVECALATKLIVKLPLIMFCVLWLVHMIDSPPSASFLIPASALRPCPQSIRQNKSFRFTCFIMLPFYVQSLCLAALFLSPFPSLSPSPCPSHRLFICIKNKNVFSFNQHVHQ